MKHLGINRDNRICVTEKITSKKDTLKWLNNFQLSLNKLIDGDCLQYIASIWNVDDISNKVLENIETIGDNTFPY